MLSVPYRCWWSGFFRSSMTSSVWVQSIHHLKMALVEMFVKKHCLLLTLQLIRPVFWKKPLKWYNGLCIVSCYVTTLVSFMKKALFIAYIATIETNILEEAIEVIQQSVHFQFCMTTLVLWSTTGCQPAAKAGSTVWLIRHSWEPSWLVGTQQTVSRHDGPLVFRTNLMLTVFEICDESTISTITWAHAKFYMKI